MSGSDEMRLARFLAKAGVASRRKSEELICAGRVRVNGKLVDTPAFNVNPDRDTIEFDGEKLRRDPRRYVLLHKPAGYTCSASDPHADRLAIDLVKAPEDVRLFSVGRLDRDSEGLLLFTNDGDFAYRLTHPKFEVPKTYEVDVEGVVKPADLRRLTKGVQEGGENLRAWSAELLGREGKHARLRIVVGEDRNREIRRMCKVLGVDVRRLLRTAFGPLELGRFRPGSCRELSREEIAALREAAGARR